MTSNTTCASPSTPRISVEITDLQATALAQIFNHGERKAYFNAVIDATINIYKKHGKTALYLMMEGRADLLQVLANGMPDGKRTNNNLRCPTE